MGVEVRAPLRDADSIACICPRVSLRFTLGYFRQAPPGLVEEIRCGVSEVRAFPGLKSETSTPRTKTCSWGPRTWGTHFSCETWATRLDGFRPALRDGLYFWGTLPQDVAQRAPAWAIFGHPSGIGMWDGACGIGPAAILDQDGFNSASRLGSARPAGAIWRQVRRSSRCDSRRS